MSAKYEYINPEHGETYPDSAIEFITKNTELENLAEDAAEQCFFDNDGWEFSWPTNFEIFENGKSLGVCSVEIETVPTFGARELNQ